MVKACNLWGIPHFPYIGHCLHLVAGPFFLEKKKQAPSTDTSTTLINGNEMGVTEDSERAKKKELTTTGTERQMKTTATERRMMT